jgi:hypothetical protein
MAFMILELLLASATAGLPNITPERVCKNAGALVLPEDRPRAYQNCVLDEQNALATLRGEWTRLPSDVRSTCGAGIGGQPSFVDILTCVELRPGGNLNETPNFTSQPRGR